MANVQVTKQELAACFAGGVFLHITVFRHGEWDSHSFTLLEVTAVLQALLSLFAHEVFSETAVSSIQHALLWAGAAVAGLYTSIIVYRALFHRLRRFPGPFPARLSQLYMTWRSFRRGQIYEDVRALHRKYGDYVRVGPSEISIADPAAFNAVHSAASQCERGPWYNILNPTISLQMVRDRKEHGRRRKAWDRAFSSKGELSCRIGYLLSASRHAAAQHPSLFNKAPQRDCCSSIADESEWTSGQPCETTKAEWRPTLTSCWGCWNGERGRSSTRPSGSSASVVLSLLFLCFPPPFIIRVLAGQGLPTGPRCMCWPRLEDAGDGRPRPCRC